MLSCRALGFFWKSKTVKNKELNAAIINKYFIVRSVQDLLFNRLKLSNSTEVSKKMNA
jgi:hypothetical protein